MLKHNDMAIISNDTIKRFTDQNYTLLFFNNDNINVVDPSTATEMSVINFEPDLYTYKSSIKLPKSKEVTYEWIMNKISDNKEFINLSAILKKHLPKGLLCYPTSYGIGVENIFRSHTENSDLVVLLLTKFGIEFTNEYSEAGWVYRFKISKSKANINKIQNIS